MKTADDLWEISNKGRFELVKGEVREMTPAGGEHGLITGLLTMKLASLVFAEHMGVILAAETGIKLPNGNVRAADIAFICKERQPKKISRSFEETVPDLVVEVLSPNDTFDSVTEKMMEWLGAGVKEAWVVDSHNRVISLYTSAREVHIFAEDDELKSTVLPGFHCSVKDIFGILD